uniref:Adenylate kinaseic-like n=1 Tax=Rhizophora mucronata TaxID=61149 RepID=A0A2P2JHE2_RHIMU
MHGLFLHLLSLPTPSSDQGIGVIIPNTQSGPGPVLQVKIYTRIQRLLWASLFENT